MSTFHIPTKLIYSPGSLMSFDLATLNSKTMVVFCSRSVRQRCDYVKNWLEHVCHSTSGCFIEEVSSGEPCLDAVEYMRRIIEIHSADLAIAVGGGSVIDAVKAAAAVAYSDSSVEDYFYGKRKLPKRECCVGVVPTTAGSGAELTPNAVLSDPKRRVKKSLRGSSLFPDYAVVDPETLRSLPEAVAASSGADALVQAIESFTSRFASPITDALSLSAALRIEQRIERYVRNRDKDSCHYMSIASSMAAMAFVHSGLGAVHGVVHTIGLISNTPHGVCCAALLPFVIEMNQRDRNSKYEHLTEMWGAPPADHIRHLFSRLLLPSDLKHLCIPRSEFDFIIDSSLDTNSMRSNPRNLGRDELMELLVTVL